MNFIFNAGITDRLISSSLQLINMVMVHNYFYRLDCQGHRYS
jgi:hypothetical protein